MKSDQSYSTSKLLRFAMAALAFAVTANANSAERLVAASFTATTANMTPAGVDLRLQVIEWQEADARAEVVATLAAGADAVTPLAKLPTVGYVWPDESPVGYSVKYAHHLPQPGGGELVTLVTDKQLGSYEFKPWSIATPSGDGDAPYSVIELEVDGSGSGTGTFSLGGEVELDEAAGTVTLDDSAAPSLLADVKREAPQA